MKDKDDEQMEQFVLVGTIASVVIVAAILIVAMVVAIVRWIT